MGVVVAPPGRQVHGAVWKGTGYSVTDVRGPQEALDSFSQILGLLLEQAGTHGGEPPEIYPAHNPIKGW